MINFLGVSTFGAVVTWFPDGWLLAAVMVAYIHGLKIAMTDPWDWYIYLYIHPENQPNVDNYL